MENKKKICIVDDDPNIIEVYGAKLKSAGFEVISAPDGDEGLVLIEKENPDLILLDIMMPKKGDWRFWLNLKKMKKLQKFQ